jgi:hypothetical protein
MSHRKAVVRTQMPSGGGKGVPTPHATDRRTLEQYPDPPFSAHPHDAGGPGGLPLKIMEDHGERLPKSVSPSFAAASGMKGAPAPGNRRFSKSAL